MSMIEDGELAVLRKERDDALERVDKLQRETQSLTCVYCGKEYPPGTPTHGSSVLTEHIKVCVQHPMRAAEEDVRRMDWLQMHNFPDGLHWNNAIGAWLRCTERGDRIEVAEVLLRKEIDKEMFAAAKIRLAAVKEESSAELKGMSVLCWEDVHSGCVVSGCSCPCHHKH